MVGGLFTPAREEAETFGIAGRLIPDCVAMMGAGFGGGDGRETDSLTPKCPHQRGGRGQI